MGIVTCDSGCPGMPGGIIPFFDIEFIDGVGERYVDTEFGSIQMKWANSLSQLYKRTGKVSQSLGILRSRTENMAKEKSKKPEQTSDHGPATWEPHQVRPRHHAEGQGAERDLDRLPMLTWIMFLKFLDDLEQVEETRAASGEEIPHGHRIPLSLAGLGDEKDGITGDELIKFINNDEAVRPDGTKGAGLFAYLRALLGQNGDGRRDVIANVFRGIQNRMISGYLLRDVVNLIDGIHFNAAEEIHTWAISTNPCSARCEIRQGIPANSTHPGRLSDSCGSHRSRLGEVVLDPACGTGGFLSESYGHLEKQCKTVADMKVLQEKSIFGGEAKPLPYMLAQMNLLLHGLKSPQIVYGNSLAGKLTEIGKRDRVDVILTNPPFGGEEEAGIRTNFPADKQTSETALLFLQLIMRKLRRAGEASEKGGRAGVVVPNGTLFGDGVCARIKHELLTEFNLHTIVRLPNGVFAPYTSIPTNLLFFDCSGPTKTIWYYEQSLPKNARITRKPSPSSMRNCQLPEMVGQAERKWPGLEGQSVRCHQAGR